MHMYMYMYWCFVRFNPLPESTIELSDSGTRFLIDLFKRYDKVRERERGSKGGREGGRERERGEGERGREGGRDRRREREREKIGSVNLQCMHNCTYRMVIKHSLLPNKRQVKIKRSLILILI